MRGAVSLLKESYLWSVRGIRRNVDGAFDAEPPDRKQSAARSLAMRPGAGSFAFADDVLVERLSGDYL
jgi:hypothetical protein